MVGLISSELKLAIERKVEMQTHAYGPSIAQVLSSKFYIKGNLQGGERDSSAMN